MRSSYFGLSPRGRGNHLNCWKEEYLRGSIPAWAGKPRPTAFPAIGKRVYPRVGGGTFGCFPLGLNLGGLSPRGRGNRHGVGHIEIMARSIPAWAGEPSDGVARQIFEKVYPRVGGGTEGRVRDSNLRKGLSPRGRGTLRQLYYQGLSPRGRGNRLGPGEQSPCLRSIPAWAGEPHWRNTGLTT